MDMVKKLMEFSKSASSPDEFVGTILRMGCRDRYALVEDFALYLLILADIARNSDSGHSSVVAEQIVDIVVRVPQVLVDVPPFLCFRSCVAEIFGSRLVGWAVTMQCCVSG